MSFGPIIQKTELFEYHWLRALAMFNIMSLPVILSGIGRHFKFCKYVNYGNVRNTAIVQNQNHCKIKPTCIIKEVPPQKKTKTK